MSHASIPDGSYETRLKLRRQSSKISFSGTKAASSSVCVGVSRPRHVLAYVAAGHLPHICGFIKTRASDRSASLITETGHNHPEESVILLVPCAFHSAAPDRLKKLGSNNY